MSSQQLTEIIGTCLIDDKPIEFLADIGTSRTIINERLVPIAERSHIQVNLLVRILVWNNFGAFAQCCVSISLRITYAMINKSVQL